MSESFLQLIEDTSLNGRALIVSNNHGTLYATFHTERFFWAEYKNVNPWSAELICKKHRNQRVFFSLKSS